MPLPGFPLRPTSSPGVALVVTLLMMSVLVMMVVGLAGVMRNEQAAARNLTYQVVAEQLADAASQQGIAAVITSTPAAGQISATGPGWIFAGSTNRYLVSPAASGADVRNLEAIGTNSLILGLPTGVRGRIFAGWSNVTRPNQPTNRPIGRYAWWVDDEGTKLNLNGVGSNNLNPFLPYLTDFLSGRTSTNLPTFPFSADWVFVDPATGNVTNTNAARFLRERTNWLPTPESLKGTNFLPIPRTNDAVTPQEYHRIKGHITTWSSNADLTPWGAPKVNLADPAVTAAQIKAMLITNDWSLFFGTNLTLSRKYGAGTTGTTNAGSFGDVVMNFIAADLQSMGGQAAAPSLSTNDLGNLSTLRHRFRLPLSPVGNQYSNTPIAKGPHPYLSEVMASVDSMAGGTSITVTLYLQIEVLNPWRRDLPANLFQLRIFPRKFRFHVTTGNANAQPAVIGPPDFPSITGTPWPDGNGPMAGLTGTLGCWAGPMMEDGNPWPSGSAIIRPVPALPARSAAIVSVPLSWTLAFTGVNPVRVDQAYLALDRVVLESQAGTVLDWVSLDDFAQTPNYGFGVNAYTRHAPDTGQMAFNRNTATYPPTRRGSAYVRAGPTQNLGGFSPADSQGLGKIDPRIRFPLQVWDPTTLGQFLNPTFPASWQAWYPIGAGHTAALPTTPSLPNNNLLTRPTGGPSGLAADPGTTGLTDILNHPHFVSGAIPTSGFKAVAQIGAAHTGIPWRTLRLQSAPAAELALGPPDWVLLDAFAATNPTTPMPQINLNGVVASLQSSNSTTMGLPVASDGQVQTRPWALLGAMGALVTNLSVSDTNFYTSNGIPESLRTNPLARYGSNGLRQIALNLRTVLNNPNVAGSGWASGSAWPTLRASRSSNFPANGLALKGELLEVRGVADDASLGEDVLEGRLRGFMDMVTTRSDTFSVWSVGQGLLVVTNAQGLPIRTNVMGEIRKQTVFQREPVINGGVVTGYRYRTVYSRGHVVE